MKKTLIVLMMVMLAALIIVSCDSSAGNSVIYKVTFDSNNGSDAVVKEVKNGEKVTKPDTPTKDNCIFVKWTTDQAGNNKYDFESAVNGDITIYAQWVALPAVGSSVNLGTYPNDYEIASNRGKAVAWKVLAIDDAEKRVLLISQNILKGQMSYSAPEIQTYLNGFISNYGLNDVSVCNVDVTSETTTVGSGADKLFLLSKTEAENKSYFADDAARIATYNGSAIEWWVRPYNGTNYAVHDIGDVFTYYNAGVRPAMWVNF